MRQYSYQFSSPRFRQLGYLTWLVLLTMAMIFYKERAIFLDGAFQLEKMINQGTFKIYHYRLTNPFTQVLALAAIYLNLPLKVVLFAYSINFILFFSGIYWAIVRWCKNDYLGWVQIFFFTLMVLDSFYFLPPDLYQGSALLLLWWAILLKDPEMQRKWVFPILILFMIPILSDSRLIPTYFFFCFVFFWLSNKSLRHVRYYALLVIMFVFMYIHGHYFVAPYDAMKMKEFDNNLNTWKSQLWNIPAHKIFFEKCVKFYYFYPIALFTVLIGYIIIYFKKIESVSFPLLKAFLTLGANIAFLLILHIGSPYTNYRFYAEVNYLPLAILCCVPLLFDILPNIKNEQWVLGAFLIIIILRINIITANHTQFEKRHQWYIDQMDKASEMGSNRSIIHTWNSPKKMIIQPWASPQETLLLSSLEGPEFSRSLLVAMDSVHYKKSLKYEPYFLTSWQKLHTSKQLNNVYFGLGEGQYIFLDKE